MNILLIWFITIFTSIDALNCGCGVSGSQNKIVGGTIAKKLEYTWLALLLDNGFFFCAASLINERYVVGAAHCAQNDIIARFLEHNLSKTSETKSFEVEIAKVIIHKKYNSKTNDYDIALFELKDAITDNLVDGTVVPICLPTTDSNFLNQDAVIAGWGTVKSGGKTSNKLRHAIVKIGSNSDCNDQYGAGSITKNMICASATGKDSCQGDSGGPLMVENDDGKYVLAGIVSFGEGCADKDFSGVYTRVSEMVKWIKRKSKSANSCDS